ncbi:MAG: hypothetical protein WBW79_14975 [Desulfocapsaceae bacterium]
MALRVLGGKNMKRTEIAATLGVSEGTVRYHLKRQAEKAIDGRQKKTQKADAYSEVISHWVESFSGNERPVNVQELHEHLETEHGYTGSYKSVLRYIRRHYPRPRMRTYRRVETPAGAQSQTDWAEYPRVAVGGDYEALSAFIMCLSHSRMMAVIWRSSKDQLSWLESHNEAYARLGGVAAVNRVDNVKTAICYGAGSWGKINQVSRSLSFFGTNRIILPSEFLLFCFALSISYCIWSLTKYSSLRPKYLASFNPLVGEIFLLPLVISPSAVGVMPVAFDTA